MSSKEPRRMKSLRIAGSAAALALFSACGSASPSSSVDDASCGACAVDAGAANGIDGGAASADARDSAVDSAADAGVEPDGGGGAVYPSVPIAVTGSDVYVSASAGLDSNPGTAAKPWKTIQHAASTITRGTSGVTVHVAPGVYTEGIQMSVSGASTAPIVFLSDVRWGAHVNAAGHYWGWQSTGDYVEIVGFEVTGADYIGIGMGGSHCRTIENHVHHLAAPTCNTGNGGAGINDYVYTATDDEMIGNVVHDIGNPGCTQIQGLYHSNNGGRMVNNIVYRISGFGLHFWHNPKNAVVANNLSFQNGAGGLVVGAGDAPNTGVAEGFVVTNNIFFDNLGTGMIEEGTYGANTYVDNLVFQNAKGNTSIGTASTITGTLAVDPGFVRYKRDGTGDYHLAAASPCIDSGTSQGAPTVDIDGTPRPQRASFDRGPYEMK